MHNDAIDFRWLQKVDDEGKKIGSPVLQQRHKFGIDCEGKFQAFWNWTEWQDVRTEEECVRPSDDKKTAPVSEGMTLEQKLQWISPHP